MVYMHTLFHCVKSKKMTDQIRFLAEIFTKKRTQLKIPFELCGNGLRVRNCEFHRQRKQHPEVERNKIAIETKKHIKLFCKDIKTRLINLNIARNIVCLRCTLVG